MTPRADEIRLKECADELAEFFYPANPPYRSKEAMAQDMTLVIARHFQTAAQSTRAPTPSPGAWEVAECIAEMWFGLGSQNKAAAEKLAAEIAAALTTARQSALEEAAKKLDKRAEGHSACADKWTPPQTDEARDWIRQFEIRQDEAINCASTLRALAKQEG